MSDSSDGQPTDFTVSEVTVNEIGEIVIGGTDEVTDSVIVETVAGLHVDKNGDLIEILKLSDVNTVQTDVPEAVASEMVVTTTHGGHKRKQNVTIVKKVEQEPKDLNATDGSEWSLGIPDVSEQGGSGLSEHQEQYVTVAQSYEVLDLAGGSDVKTLQEIQKRERDRVRKQELRKNPSIRERERDKARARMKLKRQEPGYREVERERDRMRRRIARLTNPRLRALEREADKQRKRQQRGVAVSVNDISSVLPLPSETCTYVLDTPQSSGFTTTCDTLTNSMSDDVT